MRRLLADIRLQVLQRALQLMGARRRRILAWRSMLAADVQFLTFERDGIIWNVSRDDDVVGFNLFVDGGHQHQEMQALLGWMRRRGVLSGSQNVVVDVGANIGSTCVPLIRAGDCRVLAIEPVAQSFRMLKLNVESNGLSDRIVLVKKAVLRAPGRVKMRLSKGASGDNFVWRDGVTAIAPDDGATYEEVEADALAAIVSSVGLRTDEIALVWADVQGCEPEVIESGACLWEQGVPLWAEVEPYSLARQGSVATFAALAAVHFDRFIAARDLLRQGEKAQAVPIGQLPRLMRGITPDQLNTDVLFLPPRFPA